MTTVVDLVDSPDSADRAGPPGSRPAAARPRRRALLIAAGWTMFVLAHGVALFAQIGVPFPYALASAAVTYYSLALLMVIVWRVSVRMSAARWRPARRAAAHLLLGLLILAVWQVAYAGYLRLMIGPDFWTFALADSWMFQLLTNVITYGGALAVVLALQAADRARDHERRDAARQIAAREAELIAIKAQLQPHFLMNALNTILALVDTSPRDARATIVRLSDLLHAVFDRLDADRIPLSREMELIVAYLDIERRRFGARLDVRIAIDPRAQPMLVPPFLLQPLVENAVKHGVAPQTRGGVVRVEGSVEDDRLRLIVRDSPLSGPSGPSSVSPAPAPIVEGRGLSLTRRRLDSLYGSGYGLTFTRDRREFVVSLDLPASTRGQGGCPPSIATRAPRRSIPRGLQPWGPRDDPPAAAT